MALSIKLTYTLEELEKPFVVPVVTLNYDDPTLRDAVAQRLASGVDAVFGAPKSVAALPVNIDAGEIEEADEAEEERRAIGEMEVVDTDGTLTWEDHSGADFADFGDTETHSGSDRDHIECSECGSPIEDYVRQKDGVVWSADKIVETTMKYFNRPTCAKCYFKARNRKEAAA
jgi:hypothetical protein